MDSFIDKYRVKHIHWYQLAKGVTSITYTVNHNLPN